MPAVCDRPRLREAEQLQPSQRDGVSDSDAHQPGSCQPEIGPCRQNLCWQILPPLHHGRLPQPDAAHHCARNPENQPWWVFRLLASAVCNLVQALAAQCTFGLELWRQQSRFLIVECGSSISVIEKFVPSCAHFAHPAVIASQLFWYAPALKWVLKAFWQQQQALSSVCPGTHHFAPPHSQDTTLHPGQQLQVLNQMLQVM